MKRLYIAISFIFLIGCGGAVEEAAVGQVTDSPPTTTQIVATDLPPTATMPPTPTTIPTAVPTVLVETDTLVTETAVVPTEEPTAMVMPTEEPAMFGRTPEGAFYMGHANADITLIDYSDFL